jgi:hypothetical protein
LAEFIELYEAHEARVLITSLSPRSFVVRFGEAGLRRIAVRFDLAKPAALFVIRRSIRDSGLAEYAALAYFGKNTADVAYKLVWMEVTKYEVKIGNWMEWSVGLRPLPNS